MLKTKNNLTSPDKKKTSNAVPYKIINARDTWQFFNILFRVLLTSFIGL